MTTPRSAALAVLLQSGQVLVAIGGRQRSSLRTGGVFCADPGRLKGQVDALRSSLRPACLADRRQRALLRFRPSAKSEA
jgi:hypothetical protein